jgi:hypothetical protein
MLAYFFGSIFNLSKWRLPPVSPTEILSGPVAQH